MIYSRVLKFRNKLFSLKTNLIFHTICFLHFIEIQNLMKIQKNFIWISLQPELVFCAQPVLDI